MLVRRKVFLGKNVDGLKNFNQAPGAVLALLTDRAWKVSTLTGQQLATNINAISSVLSGLLLGLFLREEGALVMCLFLPFFMLALYYGSKVNSSNGWLKEGDEYWLPLAVWLPKVS